MHRNVHLDHALDQITDDQAEISRAARRKVVRDNLALSDGTAVRDVLSSTAVRTKQGAVALGAASVLLTPQMAGVAAAQEQPDDPETPDVGGEDMGVAVDASAEVPEQPAEVGPSEETAAPDVGQVDDSPVPEIPDAGADPVEATIDPAGDEPPAEGPPIDDAPPVDEDPVDEVPAEGGPTTPEDPDEEPPTEGQPAEEPPTAETPDDQPPTDGAQDEEPPTAEGQPAEEPPTAETPDDQPPTDGAPDEEPPTAEDPGAEQEADNAADGADASPAPTDPSDQEPADPAPPAASVEPTDTAVAAPPEDAVPEVATPAPSEPAPAAPAPSQAAAPAPSPSGGTQQPIPSVTIQPAPAPGIDLSTPPPPPTVDPQPEPTPTDSQPPEPEAAPSVHPLASPQDVDPLAASGTRPAPPVSIVHPSTDAQIISLGQDADVVDDEPTIEERIRAAQSRPVDDARVLAWTDAVVRAWTSMQAGDAAIADQVIVLTEVADQPTLGWSYEVQSGDSLWDISRDLWGSDNVTSSQISATSQLIYTWNAEALGDDPDQIDPGTVIALPLDAGSDT